MNCPHCQVAFHDKWNHSEITPPDKANDIWEWDATSCPNCKSTIVTMTEYYGREKTRTKQRFLSYPKSTGRMPTPTGIEGDLKSDYEEACAVLRISAKASAALSRRCLQGILQEQGYNQKNLVDQIDAVLKEVDAAKSLPSALHTTIDAVRNFGNFSAHPMDDKSTLQIINVEPEEAEWCLEIIEEMFDHYFVKPAATKEKKDALDAKLKQAGKPNAK
jgi:hypothetical protein